MNIPLAQSLLDGGYRIFIQGTPSGEPKPCGQKTANAILSFA